MSPLSQVAMWTRWYQDQHSPCNSVALGHQHVARWKPRPPALLQPLIVSGPRDINIDPRFNRAMGPDMALNHSPGLDDTMTPVGSPSHPNQLHTWKNIALRCQHVHKLWPRPWSSMWTLAETLDRDISTDPSCDRTTFIQFLKNTMSASQNYVVQTLGPIFDF